MVRVEKVVPTSEKGRLVTFEEAGDMLRCGKRTIQRLVSGGHLRRLRMGRKACVPLDDLVVLLNRRLAGQPG